MALRQPGRIVILFPSLLAQVLTLGVLGYAAVTSNLFNVLALLRVLGSVSTMLFFWSRACVAGFGITLALGISFSVLLVPGVLVLGGENSRR
ncbi:membrane hypothetical protein [Gammaproteobacteria bacterium]